MSRRRWLILAWLPLVLLPRGPVGAQVVDTTFRPSVPFAGTGWPYISQWDLARALVVDSLGRAVLGGAFDQIGQVANPRYHSGIQRLLPSGRPDPTFDPGGTGANGKVLAIAATAGGRWLIGGTFSRYDGRPVGRVARLLPDGALDPTFNPGGSGADGQVLTINPDGRGHLLVGGDFTRYNGRPANGLVRLLPDGTPDTTFVAPPSLLGGAVHAVAVDLIGRVLVGGQFPPITANGTMACVYRLWADGRLDSAFRVDPGFRGLGFLPVGRQVLALPDGNVVLGGSFTYYDRVQRPSLIRFHDDGSLDTTLVTPFLWEHIYALERQPAGQLLVGGNSSNTAAPNGPGFLALLANSGRLTTYLATCRGTFGTPLGTVRAFSRQPGGGLIVAYATGLNRLRPDSSCDSSYAQTTELYRYQKTIGLGRQRGDRLVWITATKDEFSTSPSHVVRLFANGTPDSTFRTNWTPAGFPGRNPNVITIDAADRILIADYGHVYRLLSNGLRDTGFTDGLGASYAQSSGAMLTHVEALPDGRVLVSGKFEAYGRTPRAGLVRLGATGAVDPTFQPPVMAGFFGYDVRRLPDGTALALYDDGATTSQLYWLDSTGAPLPTFNGGQPLPGVTTLTPLSDNTALLGGRFTLNGITYQGTHKLTRAGTPAPNFVPDPSFAEQVLQAWPQPDGRLLFFDDLAHGHRLRRLLPTGALDSTFTPTEIGTGFPEESATMIVFQTGGKLVVGGAFTTADSLHRPALARLINRVTGLAPDGTPAPARFAVFPNPTHDRLTLRRPTAEAATATLLDMLGRPVRRWALAAATEQTVKVVGVPAGAYVLRVVSAAGALTRRVVVE